MAERVYDGYLQEWSSLMGRKEDIFMFRLFDEGSLSCPDASLLDLMDEWSILATKRVGSTMLARSKPEKLSGVMRDEGRYVCWFYAWQKKFTGQVPKSWEYSSGIGADLRRAREQKVRLDPGLVTAVVTHPNPSLLLVIGTTQRLSPFHLSAVLGRAEADPCETKVVLDAQASMGADSKDLSIAEKIRMKERFPLRFLKAKEVIEVMDRLEGVSRGQRIA